MSSSVHLRKITVLFVVLSSCDYQDDHTLDIIMSVKVDYKPNLWLVFNQSRSVKKKEMVDILIR